MNRIKILAVFFCTAIMAALTSCNRTIIDVNYTFDKAIILVGGEWMTVEVEEWRDYEGDQIQIEAKDGTVYLVHANNCTLICNK